MIVGQQFIWLHFPKCAGVEVENILRSGFGELGALAFDPIDFKSVNWHDTIFDRERNDPTFQVGDRSVICGFRRLPFWLLSRIHFEKARSRNVVVTREMFLKGQFYETKGLVLSADYYAREYSSHPVQHWIRTESIKEDFMRVFSNYLDLSIINVSEAFTNQNRSPLTYIQDLEFFFKPEELCSLYDANPIWRKLEEAVYGDILRL